MTDTIEKQVFELIEDYNGYNLLGKRFKLTLDTDLYKNFRMLLEDAIELSERYLELFKIDPRDFNIVDYFPNEGGFLITRFLLPKEIRPTGKKPIPLTIRIVS
ncbi:DUF1493 family protein [Neisseriaceae bacterium TC5R-5]|nr:DUF1493 family protein [Neisseriaceae bacterium TC5R-5]